MTQEALKQALEALYPISHNNTDDYRGQADKAITSLRQAIAELESQEPVAWMRKDATLRFADGKMFAVGQPFYTHPPQRTWVGLTDEDLEPLCNEWRIVFGSWTYEFAKAIEAKLKEKNT